MVRDIERALKAPIERVIIEGFDYKAMGSAHSHQSPSFNRPAGPTQPAQRSGPSGRPAFGRNGPPTFGRGRLQDRRGVR